MRAYASTILGILFVGTILFAQPVQQPPAGELLSLIQYIPMGDIEKSERFYHDTLGLESLAGDPRMRFGWYGVVPFLTEMYTVKGNARNYSLRIPGTDMGVEPVEWSEANGKPLPVRIQDPGAAHLIMNTWNMDAIVERINRSGAQIVTAGRKPVTVDAPGGKQRVLWVRDLNGFFIQIVQPEPPPPAAGANGAPASSYWLGASAGFTVENTDAAVRFYRDVLGLPVETSEFSSDRNQLALFGLSSGEYRTTTVRLPGNSPHIRLLEFRGVDRKPIRPRIEDPNALVLRFRVRGIDALTAKLKAAQTRIVSLSGGPIANGPTRWLMLQDPNNMYVQFTEAPAGAPNPGAPAPPR
jgi:catechol 2,3-dioxygenase-like lactoylglutathione lyase family enzyme